MTPLPRPATAAPRRALERHAPLLLVSVQLAVFALIYPRGDFPLADDWAYVHSVRWLLDEHRVRLSDWAGMNLLPQTLLGGMAAVLFGLSSATLRCVTELVSVGVALATFRWFVTTGLGRRDAFVATLVVIATPFWGMLANSFMTDLYAMLFAIPAATLYVTALSRPAWSTIVLATLLAIAGVLERQVVAVIPAAFAVAWIATARPLGVRGLCIAAAPLLAATGAEYAYYTYLALGPGVPEGQLWLHGRVFTALHKMLVDEGGYRRWVISNIVTITGYLGLFVTPWALWVAPPASRTGRIAALVGTAAIVAATFAFDWWPPYRASNIVDAAGIGPFTLYDALPRGLVALDRSPGVVWRIAGIGTALGIVTLGCTLWGAARTLVGGRGPDRALTWFVVTLLGGYLAPFVITDYFDRYLLFILPFVLALMRRGPSNGLNARRIAALAWITGAIVLGGAATHDYFAWNRARWDAIGAAERLGATPDTLDGGFEYNGLHRYEERPRDPRAGKSFWWVRDDRYVVAFSVPPGYVERQRFPVDRWLSRTPSAIYLVEREQH